MKMIKKTTAFMLICSLLLSLGAFTGMNVKTAKAEEIKEYWNQTTLDYSFMEGNPGNWSEVFAQYDKQDVFEIDTAAQLASVLHLIYFDIDFTGKTIALTKDIDVAGKEWKTFDINFNGVFDGQGHVIENITSKEDDFAGLFFSIGINGEVKNLTIKNPIIQSSNYLGVLAYKNQGIIMNCHIISTDDRVNIEKSDDCNGGINVGGLFYMNRGMIVGSSSNLSFGDVFAGGICNRNDGGTIKDSIFTGKTTTSGNLGIAQNQSGTITNCIAAGTMSGADSYPISDQCTNCYYTQANVTNLTTVEGATALSASEIEGEAAATNLAGFDFNNIWQTNENALPSVQKTASMDEFLPIGADELGFKSGTATILVGEEPKEYPVIIDNRKKTIVLQLPKVVLAQAEENNTLTIAMVGNENTQDYEYEYETLRSLTDYTVWANSKTSSDSEGYEVFLEVEAADMTFSTEFGIGDFENSDFNINSDDGFSSQNGVDKFTLVFSLYGDTEGLTKDNIIHEWFQTGLVLAGENTKVLKKTYQFFGEPSYYGYMKIGEKEFYYQIAVVGNEYGTPDWEISMEKDTTQDHILDLPKASNITFQNMADGTSVTAEITSGWLLPAIMICSQGGGYENYFSIVSNKVESGVVTGAAVSTDCKQNYYTTTLTYEGEEELKEYLNCQAKTVETVCPCQGKEWFVVREATYTEEGLEEYRCPVCGTVYDSRIIAKKVQQVVTPTPTPILTVTPAPTTEPVVNNTKALGKVSLTKVKSKKGKKVEVFFKKLSGAKGYEVQYATNSKLKKAKTKTTTKTKLILSKLTKKKTYYIRVRAFSKEGTKKVYGKWSVVKKAKVKK